jgi:hypothetical protein
MHELELIAQKNSTTVLAHHFKSHIGKSME